MIDEDGVPLAVVSLLVQLLTHVVRRPLQHAVDYHTGDVGQSDDTKGNGQSVMTSQGMLAGLMAQREMIIL